MSKFRIGACFFPTTTLLVEDNENFLLKTYRLFLSKNISCRFYSEPLKAQYYLEREYQLDSFPQHCVIAGPENNSDSFMSQLDIKKIHREIYNPKRFEQISVIGADYAMPTINGLEFFRGIQEQVAKKMLITGEAGYALAVEAFNEGIIDKFIKKDEANLSNLLIQYAKELQAKYFLALTEDLFAPIQDWQEEQFPSCLSDPIFVEHFKKICTDNNAVEYYLLDEHGSFLLLDADAKPSWFIVKNAKAMEGICEFVHDFNVAKDILEGLKQKTLVPYFHTNEDWQIGYDDETCRRYLHPANVLHGMDTYYCAYVVNPDVYQLDRKKILSFNKYMEDF